MKIVVPQLRVSVADTPHKQAKGLMFVDDMPFDQGMLFVFSNQRMLSFWGENTFIPLDIAFADSEGKIHDVKTISPFSLSAVRSSVPCKYAIEANLGYFTENKISVGDSVDVEEDVDGYYLSFAKKRRNLASGGGREKLAQLTPDPNQLITNTPEDAQTRYESLPQLTPEDIGMALEDNAEESPVEVRQPSREPPEDIPVELPEEEPTVEETPQFENAFDASDWARPTIDNGFKGREMRISYTTKNGRNIVRDVEPHGTFHAETTGNKVLVTFDKTVSDIRAFIISNINGFAFSDDEFEPKFRI